MSASIVHWLKQRSKVALIGAGLLIVLAVGTVDHLTPAAMSFAILYLVPVLIVTWFAGRGAGVGIACASAIAWLIVNREQAAPTTPAFIPYWNALSGLIVFLAVVFLMAVVKALKEGLEGKVEQRTAELKAEVGEHWRTEELLRTSEQRFRQLAEVINEVFWMTDTANSQVIYVSPGYEVTWGRTCASLYALPASRLDAIHPDDRERVQQAASSSRLDGGYDEEYRIVRPDGGIRWVRDRAYPIYDKAGAVYRIAGIAEDITERKRLEKKVLEVSDQEQRRIGQDLHDGLCQHLTATMIASKILQEELGQQSSPQAAQAGQIATFLDRAIRQARDVARGLDPVKVATNGLMSALEELANTIRTMHRIDCVFQSDAPVLIDDDATAIHLYRIAQEAVNNAVKHAKPTRVEIGLANIDTKIALSIKDDGVGLPKASKRRSGMGWQTMHYRARMIGAALDVRRAPEGGTVVTCTLLKTPAVKPTKEIAGPVA
jgi:PAS domain S-box-containing protein